MINKGKFTHRKNAKAKKIYWLFCIKVLSIGEDLGEVAVCITLSFGDGRVRMYFAVSFFHEISFIADSQGIAVSCSEDCLFPDITKSHT